MSQDDGAMTLFHRMGGMPDQRHQLMMMQPQQHRIMASRAGGDGESNPRQFDPLLGTPSSRMAAVFGEMGQYEHQSQSMPAGLGRQQVADQAHSSMNHSISDFGSQNPTMDNGIFPERRNTWSGMSQAQQETFHQMQMERLQREEELLQAQLRQHRQMYMEHQRQMQEERQRRSSLREFNQTRPENRSVSVDEMAARRVGQHPDSWTELTPETQTKPNRGGEQLLPQQSPSNRYPSTWFEADSNIEDARNSLREDLVRRSPDLHGDLNQKLSGRSISSSSAPPFLGQQADPGLKDGKKPEGNLWNPIQLKEKDLAVADSSRRSEPDTIKMQDDKSRGNQRAPTIPSDGQQAQRVDPSSVHALGMRLDDESVSFLANLRFGGGLSTPDGSPSSGNSR